MAAAAAVLLSMTFMCVCVCVSVCVCVCVSVCVCVCVSHVCSVWVMQCGVLLVATAFYQHNKPLLCRVNGTVY